MRHIAVAYHQTLIVPGSNQAPPAISHIKSPRAGLSNFNYAADDVIQLLPRRTVAVRLSASAFSWVHHIPNSTASLYLCDSNLRRALAEGQLRDSVERQVHL